VLGWLWRLICWAFGETGRKAAFYCRFLFVPSLFLFSLRLSVSVCLCSWSTVPRFWLSGSGSISAALLGLVLSAGGRVFAAVVLALALLVFRLWL
jgi:hypothetical protein